MPQSTPIPPKTSAAGITNSGNPRNDGTSSSSVQFPNHWNSSTPSAIGTNSHRYGDVDDQLQHEREPGDLGGQRQHVQDDHGQQRHDAKLETEPLSQHLEHGPLGRQLDATGHLGVHHRPDHAHGQYPEQREAVRGSGCRKRHQLANVHESADRRDDSQSDRRELPHAICLPAKLPPETG